MQRITFVDYFCCSFLVCNSCQNYTKLMCNGKKLPAQIFKVRSNIVCICKEMESLKHAFPVSLMCLSLLCSSDSPVACYTNLPKRAGKERVCVCVYERKKNHHQHSLRSMYNCRTYKHVNRAAITAHFAHGNQFLFISIQPVLYIYFFPWFHFRCTSTQSKKEKKCRRNREMW